jgi:hypothetical protein
MTRSTKEHLPRRSRSGIVCLAVIPLFLIALPARLAKADPVDDLIEQGMKLRAEKKPAEALILFKQAHAISPSARTLAQIGLAEGTLHRWTEAETDVSAALGLHDTPWIENKRNREALEQALTSIRHHIGSITIAGPKGVVVAINGQTAGVLPLDHAVRLPEGHVHIEGMAAGYTSGTADLELGGGDQTNVLLDMPPLGAPLTSLPLLPVEATRAPSGREGGSRWKTWAGVSVAAASLGALGAGITWLVIDGEPDCGAPAGAVCHHLYDTKAQGWIAVGAAALGGAAGTYLISTGRRSRAFVGVGLGSLQLSGHF